MTTNNDLVGNIHAAFENESAINLHKTPIAVFVRDDGSLVLEGNVEDIITKRRAAQLAAMAAGAHAVLDHLRLIPSDHRGDGHILDLLYEALCQEPVFHGCTIVAVTESQPDKMKTPPDNETGFLEIEVADGVVNLNGHVQSLSHKRLAHVLAWWTPGVADVDDRLRITPPEQDNDDEITDALRIIFEKDPWLDASQLQIHTHNRKILLEGIVHSNEQRHMAECDAWYIPGVHGVINHIEVRP